MSTQTDLTDFVKYLYLALKGYENKDIITSYVKDNSLSTEDLKNLLANHSKDFGDFCKEIGIADNALQVKLYNYLSHYTLKDSICRYSEIELEQSREQYNHVLQKIKKHNIEEVLAELESLAKYEDINSSENLNQPTENLVLSSEEVISESKDIVAKSVVIKNLSIDSAKMKISANDGNVSISQYNSTGNLPKSVSNAQLIINDMGTEDENDFVVNINKSNFGMSGYNCIEIGLNTTSIEKAPKEIYIDGLDFTAPLSNNAIIIFGTQNNSYIKVSNCHFADVSNCVRLSNKFNASGVVIDFVNCTCDKWESNTPKYTGFLLFQDYTSGSLEAEEENNLFGQEKMTINFIDCYGPYGKILPSSLEEACGSGILEKQILYVYGNKSGNVPYGDGSKYPTVTFK